MSYLQGKSKCAHLKKKIVFHNTHFEIRYTSYLYSKVSFMKHIFFLLGCSLKEIALE